MFSLLFYLSLLSSSSNSQNNQTSNEKDGSITLEWNNDTLLYSNLGNTVRLTKTNGGGLGKGER